MGCDSWQKIQPPPYDQRNTNPTPPPYSEVDSLSHQKNTRVRRPFLAFFGLRMFSHRRTDVVQDDCSEIRARTPVIVENRIIATATVRKDLGVESSTRILRPSQISAVVISDGHICIQGDALLSSKITAKSAQVGGYARVTAPLDIEGNVDVAGNCEISGPISAKGKVTIGGDCTVSGDVTCAGDATFCSRAHVSGKVNIYGNLTVSESALISGDVIAHGAILVIGHAQVTRKMVARRGIQVVGWSDVAGRAKRTQKETGRRI